MTASISLICGPSGSGKTAHLVEHCLARVRAAPESVLWLAPTHRAADEVREWLPGCRIVTFPDFFDEIVRVNDAAAQSLSAVQRRLLVEEIVSRLQEEKQLTHFDSVRETRGFIEGVSALLAELQRAEITAVQLDSAAGSPKERQCALIYARYEQQLQRLHVRDAEGRARDACDLLSRKQRQPFADVRFVFVDGFTDFSGVQHDALRLLANEIDELWITLPDEAGDERAELFSRPRDTLRQIQAWSPTSSCSTVGRISKPPHENVSGLEHLQRQLFRPLRKVEIADKADGLLCIEAPGMVGETRSVAREIKLLLRDGVPPKDILVTLRDVQPYADLVREVFADYEIAVEMDGAEPLTRSHVVALLLRALRLAEDDYAFAPVTALLRNTYFRPEWPEVLEDPQRPVQAEVLLRLLGEPRGRDSYLTAVERWAEKPDPGLEDEQAEESRRQYVHKLAKLCGPFLQRFFHAWDSAPTKAALADHINWVRTFAEDMGFLHTAAEDPRDRAALDRLFDELADWRQRDGEMVLDRRTFQRRLNAVAGEAGLPRTSFGPERVRVLSANLAQHLHAPHVFVLGLGERSFPRLSNQYSLLDETERQRLKQAGVDLSSPSDLMATEMLLFYQIVTSAQKRLVLSYPAVDERGQALLPSSFYAAVLECFQPKAVEAKRQQMLIEGHKHAEPLSLAEYRVRLAVDCKKEPALLTVEAGDDWRTNLADAAGLMRLRFREKYHNAYDGLLRDPAVIGQLQQMFGPQKVFSPTALEDYVTCPFRFFLSHVLHLEPLEEPSEEIEMTRRGQAVHRALARLHRKLKEDGVHAPSAAVDAEVLHEIQTSVDEDIRRAPSLASKELWRLEGQRLLRTAARYGVQWEKFLKPWHERGVVPQPHLFEVDFGLPSSDGTVSNPPLVIKADQIEVRISGRIDRVDLAETPAGVGFWIIDYKTGRSSNYTSAHLAEFRRLQLTLYALAVEEVLLRDRQARPLGLAYWLVNEDGPKVALPASRNQVLWLDETQRWRTVREQLQSWIVTLVKNIRQGVFPLEPRSEHCTQTCSFGQICRITQARTVEKKWTLDLPLADA